MVRLLSSLSPVLLAEGDASGRAAMVGGVEPVSQLRPAYWKRDLSLPPLMVLMGPAVKRWAAMSIEVSEIVLVQPFWLLIVRIR